MPTVGEQIERGKEKKEEEERIREQEFQYQAQLAQVQAQEERRRQQARQNQLKALARQVARRQIAKAVKRRAVAWAARGAVSALAAAAPYILPALAVIAGIFLVVFIIIATIAVLCNPQGWGPQLASVGARFSGIISQETCRSFSGFSGVSTAIEQGQNLMCQASQAQVLAAQFNTLYPAGDSPNLVQLMSCIEGDMSRKGYTNLGTRFTYERTNDLCNYTRGTQCGPCAHSPYSCHYGGQSGTRGAEAVDYGNVALAGEIIRSARFCNAGFAQTERTHVHISTQSCTGDSGDGEL